jgi:hypothetical protein
MSFTSLPPVAAELRAACKRLKVAALAPFVSLEEPPAGDPETRSRGKSAVAWAVGVLRAVGQPFEEYVASHARLLDRPGLPSDQAQEQARNLCDEQWPDLADKGVLEVLDSTRGAIPGMGLYRGVDLVGEPPEHLRAPPNPALFVSWRRPIAEFPRGLVGAAERQRAEEDADLFPGVPPENVAAMFEVIRNRYLWGRNWTFDGGEVVPPDTEDGKDVALAAAQWPEIARRWTAAYLWARSRALRLAALVEEQLASLERASYPELTVRRLAKCAVLVEDRRLAGVPVGGVVRLPPSPGKLLLALATKGEAISTRDARRKLLMALPELAGVIEPAGQRGKNESRSRVAEHIRKRWTRRKR